MSIDFSSCLSFVISIRIDYLLDFKTYKRQIINICNIFTNIQHNFTKLYIYL